jgi:DNA (cytosine-5)-methyltransferase 1
MSVQDHGSKSNPPLALDELHQNPEPEEDVLCVPKRLCQTGYDVLKRFDCVPRAWHLEGRFGSRTHRIDNDLMGLPLISKERLLEQATTTTTTTTNELQALIDTEHVKIVRKPLTTSIRAREPPETDARLHPERAPPDWSLPPSLLFAREATTPTLPDTTTPPSSFTYAELFAGVGGFGVALEALGGECVFCSELEDHCRALYRKNFDTLNVHGDIYDVPDDALPAQKSLDLLVGGFPCQPFSKLGAQPGLECPKGNLFLQIVRVLEYSQPKAFLLENVPGLLSMTETYTTIVKALTQAGYDVTTEVCGSRGVTATNRKRLFFVGLRQDRDHESKLTTTAFEFPFVPDLKLRAADMVHYEYSNKDVNDDIDIDIDLLRLADTTMQQLLTCKRWRPASMAWPNSVCGPIISHYGNSVGRGESQLVPCRAPHNPRRFSPRECARLMGFPHTFAMADRRDGQSEMAHVKEQYRMFGNAVCPPLMAALAGAVLAHCPGIVGYQQHDDWVVWGRETSMRLGYAARIPTPISKPLTSRMPMTMTTASVPPAFLKKRKRDSTPPSSVVVKPRDVSPSVVQPKDGKQSKRCVTM